MVKMRKVILNLIFIEEWFVSCNVKPCKCFPLGQCQVSVITHQFISHKDTAHTLSDLFLLPLSLGIMGAGSLKTEVFTTQHSPLEFLELPKHVGLAVWHRQLSLNIDRVLVGYLGIFYQGPSVCLHTCLSVCLSVCVVQLKQDWKENWDCETYSAQLLVRKSDTQQLL